jgi:hypothetical protein
VFQVLYRWLLNRLFTQLNRSYLVLGEVVEKNVFQSEMRKLFQAVLFKDKWHDKRHNLATLRGWKTC